MKCDEVMDQITHHLLQLNLDRPRLESLLTHVAGCSDCLESLGALLGMTGGRELAAPVLALRSFSCSDFENMVAEFAEMDEAERKSTHPVAWLHAQTCHDCRIHLQLIRNFIDKNAHEILTLVEQSKVATLPQDNYVRACQAFPWRQTKTGWRCLTSEIRIAIPPFKAGLEKLSYCQGMPDLSTPPALIRLVRDDALAGQIPTRLIVPDSEGQRQIILTVSLEHTGEANLVVQFADFLNGVPVLNAHVDLLDGHGTLLFTAISVSENDGEVHFDHLKPGTYKLRINELGSTWEMDLTLCVTSHNELQD